VKSEIVIVNVGSRGPSMGDAEALWFKPMVIARVRFGQGPSKTGDVVSRLEGAFERRSEPALGYVGLWGQSYVGPPPRPPPPPPGFAQTKVNHRPVTKVLRGHSFFLEVDSRRKAEGIVISLLRTRVSPTRVLRCLTSIKSTRVMSHRF